MNLGDMLGQIRHSPKAQHCSSVVEEIAKSRQEFRLFSLIWKDLLRHDAELEITMKLLL